jgi:monoterpene epsilon-lactone hydrolase
MTQLVISEDSSGPQHLSSSSPSKKKNMSAHRIRAISNALAAKTLYRSRIEPRSTNVLKAGAVAAVLKVIRFAVLRNKRNMLKLTHESPVVRNKLRNQLHKGMELGVEQSINILKRRNRGIKIFQEMDEEMDQITRNVVEMYLKEHGSGSMILEEKPDFKSYRFQALIEGKQVEDNGSNAILYLHGGAYIVCSPKTHAGLCIYLSAESGGIPVYALDYPMAPEYQYPAALNSAVEAYKMLLARGFKNIVIAGDSAGGNLTLSLTLKLKELELPLPKCVVALSPWADLTHSGESIHSNSEVDPMLPRELLNTAAEFYVQDEKDISDPFVSPIFASKEQLEGFPPLLIHVGENEVLYDDSIRMAAKIGTEQTELVIWEGMHHVFQISVGALEESDRAVQDVARFILSHIK